MVYHQLLFRDDARMSRATVFVFQPAFRVSRLLGLVAFPWPEDSVLPSYHRATSAALLVSVILCGIHSQVIAAVQLLAVGTMSLDVVVSRTQMVLCSVTVAALALSVVFRAPNTRRLILTLIKADNILQNSAYRQLSTKTLTLLTAYITIWLMILLSLTVKNRANPWIYLPYMASVIIILCAEQNVIALTAIIKNRFQYINSELEDMRSEFSIKQPWTVAKVRRVASKGASRCPLLRHAHADLCDALRDLDATYRGPMLADLTSHFFTIVGGLYLLYVFATGHAYYDENSRTMFSRPDLNRFVTFAGITLFSATRVIVIAHSCDATVAEVSFNV